jgi:hypothetical protein
MQVSIHFHDISINMGNFPLDMNDAASCLSPKHGISIFLTSNPVFLVAAVKELQTHPKLKHQTTLTFYYTKVPYTADTPAPPHLSGFFIMLFSHNSCPFSSIWKPSPSGPTTSSPFSAPTCYLSHIPLPPVPKEDS